MSNLKPCPFCGGEAQTTLRNIGDSGEDFWSVECFDPECGCDFCLYTTEAEAIEAWNTRAERTCKRVLFEPTGVLVCSECGAGMPKQLDKHCYLHYCPNCGARVERREQ